MSNRRVAGVERIIEQEVDGIMPVTADASSGGEAAPRRIAFFQGETAIHAVGFQLLLAGGRARAADDSGISR